MLQSKDAVGNITKYEYDALGNETKITYGDGSSHSKEYDNCGRLAKETDELGAVTTILMMRQTIWYQNQMTVEEPGLIPTIIQETA